ncbi:MAG: iron-containing alcohol dehydrogenase [Sphaerochaetaceae bacterium]
MIEFDKDIQFARILLGSWRGGRYVSGSDSYGKLQGIVSSLGRSVLVVFYHRVDAKTMAYIRRNLCDSTGNSLEVRFVSICKEHAEKEDVYRLETYLLHYRPDSIMAIGGGETIDLCKAAVLLYNLGTASSCEIDTFYGVGKVTRALRASGRKLIPIIAVQATAISGTHISKYINIVDMELNQKKLIVDEALVPTYSVFDYSSLKNIPLDIIIDGALDAVAHVTEVFYAVKNRDIKLVQTLTELVLELVLTNLPRLIKNPQNLKAGEALSVAADLGGYAIMLGGTSGGHLNSFSLVGIVSHGIACTIMNPYYMVFYGKAIQYQLHVIGTILQEHNFLQKEEMLLDGRDYAEAVARAMMAFSASISIPTRLDELYGFSETYIHHALTTAKDPELKMKLQNMPIRMEPEDVDTYMEPVLRAAQYGNLSLIHEI